MSWVYFAAPETLSGASTRGCGLPTTLSSLRASHGLGSPAGSWTSMSRSCSANPTLSVTL
ncbi:hypothetical protein [Nannocystis pusilla]|uniref:hypothetical protein n=1 Tax=Nannocystis pusilla TaxID=889268 RepID=UPI003DA3FAB0